MLNRIDTIRKGNDKIFIETANKIHNNKYDYSEINYTTNKKKVIIICPIHGKFTQRPNNHLHGHGCSKCVNVGFSQKQIAWLEYMSKKLHIYIQHALNDGEFRIGKYKVDGYCKETNMCFEFYGTIFHGDPKICNKDSINPLNKKTYGELYDRTLQREEFIEKKGYNIIKIWECDWDKLSKSK